MDFDKIINKKKKDLIHKRHGGEIYKKKIFKGKSEIIDFSININPLNASNKYSEWFKESLSEIQKYPDSESLILKERLVSYFSNRIKLENIIIGAGSMELITNFCDIFIEPNDNIIISQPTFSEYEWAIRKNLGDIINIPRDLQNNFKLEKHPIMSRIDPQTKAIFICNPNNPNGNLENFNDIEEIIKFSLDRNILVFLDEAFIEFTGEENSFINKINKYKNLFVSRSFTKFFGIPGLRIGFGVGDLVLIKHMKKAQNLWSVNCIGQKFAEKMLYYNNFIKSSISFVNKERNFLISELSRIPKLKLFTTRTNFILINIENTGIRSHELKKILLEKNILIRDCSNFKYLDNYYIRISVKDRESNIKLIQTLKSII
ncbi:MAG: pyridoxal phosphate-dependent aminotransferase [Promethearchaeota archaeon]